MVVQPTVVVAVAHCSGHATHPSNRITDPENAEALSSATMHKHKAPGHHINCKVIIDDKGSTDGGEINNYEANIAEHPATTSDDEAGDTEPNDLAYTSTKAMGDADHEVRLFFSLSI